MKKRLLSLILLSGLLSTSLIGCSNPSESTNSSIIKENPSESEIHSEEETSSKEEFNEKPDLKEENFSSFTHSAHLIDELNKSYKDGNIVISGMSLDFALAMLMNGTNKEATEELESFLGMTKKEANNYYSNLYDFYNKNDIVVANSFWFEEAINSSINSDYIDVISSKYKSTIQGISMNKTGADIINKWVNTNTNGLINKVIDTMSFDKEEDNLKIDARKIIKKYPDDYYKIYSKLLSKGYKGSLIRKILKEEGVKYEN